MVFFACNHCGESVKKAAVEKHYSFKCRGRPVSVSCMDCQKDFYGDDHVAHTSCISEQEKYSGKDFVPKKSSNKGRDKQESWTDIIRSILDNPDYTLSNKAREGFKLLCNYSNVPRKKIKFQNFARICVRLYQVVVDEIWVVLEKELDKLKQPNAGNGQPQPAIEGKEEEMSKPETSNDAIESEYKMSAKKRKKEKKEKLQIDANVTKDETEPSRKVKSKKQRKQKAECEIASSNGMAVVQATTKDSSKAINGGEECTEPSRKVKKSKKVRKQKDECEVTSTNGTAAAQAMTKESEAINGGEECIPANGVKTKSKKSKKSGKQTTDECNTNHQEPVETTRKSGKRKISTNDELETTGTKKSKNSEEVTSEIVSNCENLFSWKTVFINTVQKYEKGIDLEKLKRKILKKYKSSLHLDAELDETQRKNFETKFRYKLRKCTNLELVDNIVKICSS